VNAGSWWLGIGVAGGRTHCWGSEGSAVRLGFSTNRSGPPVGGSDLSLAVPASPLWWGGWCGVGLLFEIWIVDASILWAPTQCVGVCLFVACSHRDCGVGVLLVFCGFVHDPRFWGVVCVHHESPPPGLCGWWGLVVCVTSCEGHMVDALASRADEGRRSLR
jgi:hypothetical protein